MRMWTKMLAAAGALALAACGLKPSDNVDESVTAGFGSAKVVTSMSAHRQSPAVVCTPGIIKDTFKVTAERILDSKGNPVTEDPIYIPPNKLPGVSPVTGDSGTYEFRFDTLRAGTYQFSAGTKFGGCGCDYDYATSAPVVAKVDPKPAPAPRVVLLLQQGEGTGDTCPSPYFSDIPFVESVVMTGACGAGETGLTVSFDWRDADDRAVEWHADWRPAGGSWGFLGQGNSPDSAHPLDPSACTTPASQDKFCGAKVEIPGTFPPMTVPDGDYEVRIQVTSKRSGGNTTPPHLYGLVIPYKCTHDNGAAELLLCLNPAPIIQDIQATNVADSQLGGNFGWPLATGQTVNIVGVIVNEDPFASELTECFWGIESGCAEFLQVQPLSSSGKNCQTSVTLTNVDQAKAAALPGMTGRYCKLSLQVWDVFATYACPEQGGTCSEDPCYNHGQSCARYPGNQCSKGGSADGELWLWVGETSVTLPPVRVIWASTTPQSATSVGTEVGPLTLVVDPGDATKMSYEWTLKESSAVLQTTPDNPNTGSQNFDQYTWTASCTTSGFATISVKMTPDVGPVSTFDFMAIPVPKCP